MRVGESIVPARLGTTFRWLLASSWVSNLGDGITLAGGPLLVTSLTRDPFLVSLSVVLQRLPFVLFGLVFGVLADRLDRRRIMLVMHLSRAAVLAGLTAAIALDRASIALVLVVLFVLGTLETFADTTASTLTPMVVHRDDLGIANARVMAGFMTVNQLVGPPVGAALFAVDRILPFAAEAACMVVATVLTARIVLPPHGVDAGERHHVVREIAEGLRWLWHDAAVRTLAITIVVFNVTYGAAWSVLVLYAIERLHTGEVGFGLLTSALALGGVAGTALYDRLSARVSLGNLMRAGLIIETCTHAALALTTSRWLALVIMFFFGAHASVWGTTATTIRHRAVPIALQGRVGSAYLLGLQLGIVLGGAVGGPIAKAGGVTAPFWFAFAGSALLVVLIWRQLSHVAHAADDAAPAAEP